MAELSREDFQSGMRDQAHRSDQNSRDQLDAISGLALEIRGFASQIVKLRASDGQSRPETNGKTAHGLTIALFSTSVTMIVALGSIGIYAIAGVSDTIQTERSDRINAITHERIDRLAALDLERRSRVSADILNRDHAIALADSVQVLSRERHAEADKTSLLQYESLVTLIGTNKADQTAQLDRLEKYSDEMVKEHIRNGPREKAGTK